MTPLTATERKWAQARGDIATLGQQQAGCVWSSPRPLMENNRTAAYPVAALPGQLRQAVMEVQQFVQAPMGLVACSAMAAISMVVQPHVDIARDKRLCGPTSLYLLTIADSNERKSTVDRLFTRPIIDYQDERAAALMPQIKQYQAASSAWEAREKGLHDQIRHLSKQGKPTQEVEARLSALQDERPPCPKVPRLVYEDVTPEKLRFNLARVWPCAGILSSEGGAVLGSYGMQSDSLVSNLATYNKLWSGEEITVDRRTSESFVVRGARLTASLQVQEAPLMKFLAKAGDVARGSGFLARFLFSRPQTTQGTRMYAPSPEVSPGLEAFSRRIKTLLDLEPVMDEQGRLCPVLLQLSPEAKQYWINFHNTIELQLAPGQSLATVRDISGKIADNAARIAALLHVFTGGLEDPVGKEIMDAACTIATWHLNEALCFYGELALPGPLAHAVKLDRWLVDMCCRQANGFQGNTIARRDIQRLVTPTALRQSEALDESLALLVEADRVRLVQHGKRKQVQVNPALVEEDMS